MLDQLIADGHEIIDILKGYENQFISLKEKRRRDSDNARIVSDDDMGSSSEDQLIVEAFVDTSDSTSPRNSESTPTRHKQPSRKRKYRRRSHRAHYGKHQHSHNDTANHPRVRRLYEQQQANSAYSNMASKTVTDFFDSNYSDVHYEKNTGDTRAIKSNTHAAKTKHRPSSENMINGYRISPKWDWVNLLKTRTTSNKRASVIAPPLRNRRNKSNDSSLLSTAYARKERNSSVKFRSNGNRPKISNSIVLTNHPSLETDTTSAAIYDDFYTQRAIQEEINPFRMCCDQDLAFLEHVQTYILKEDHEDNRTLAQSPPKLGLSLRYTTFESLQDQVNRLYEGNDRMVEIFSHSIVSNTPSVEEAISNAFNQLHMELLNLKIAEKNMIKKFLDENSPLDFLPLKDLQSQVSCSLSQILHLGLSLWNSASTSAAQRFQIQSLFYQGISEVFLCMRTLSSIISDTKNYIVKSHTLQSSFNNYQPSSFVIQSHIAVHFCVVQLIILFHSRCQWDHKSESPPSFGEDCQSILYWKQQPKSGENIDVEDFFQQCEPMAIGRRVLLFLFDLNLHLSLSSTSALDLADLWIDFIFFFQQVIPNIYRQLPPLKNSTAKPQPPTIWNLIEKTVGIICLLYLNVYATHHSNIIAWRIPMVNLVVLRRKDRF